jgi:hypothetical protein
MASLGGVIVTGEDLYTETSTPLMKVGTLGFDTDGNRYRYVKNGAVALVTGNLLQEPAEDTNFNNMAVTSGTAGNSYFTVTLGGTAVTADLFKDGLLFVSYSTGIGQTFRITSHTVQTSTSGACTFTVDRPIKISVATSTSKVTVRKNPYNGVIQSPTTCTGGVVGVALYAMTISYYGWIQSGGLTSVLADTGTNFSDAVGGVSRSAGVAGSVKPCSGSEGEIIIGQSMNVTSTDSYMLAVKLFLD